MRISITHCVLAGLCILPGTLAASTCSSSPQNVVANCGFETGDFSNWSLNGDTTFTFVETNPFVGFGPNSGTYFAALGTFFDIGSLSQALITTAGQQYTLSWYLGTDGLTPSNLMVNWNNSNVYASSDPVTTSGGYQLFSFQVTGTGSDNLSFNFVDANGFFALDDVSVTPTRTPEPAAYALVLLGGFLLAARRRFLKIGLACVLAYVSLPGMARADALTVNINGTQTGCLLVQPGPTQLAFPGAGGVPNTLRDIFNCTVSVAGEGSFRVSGLVFATNGNPGTGGFNASLAFQATVVALTIDNPAGTTVSVDVKQIFTIPQQIGTVDSVLRADGLCNNALNSAGALYFFVNGAQNQMLNGTNGPRFNCPTITGRQTGGGPGSGGNFVTLEQIGTAFFPPGSVASDAVALGLQQVAFDPAFPAGAGPFLPPPAPPLPNLPPSPCPPYICDDGTTETSLGVTPPGSSIAWMNSFKIAPGRETISSISLAFGRPGSPSGLVNGQPVTLYLWVDPTGTGNPGLAQVIATSAATVQNTDTNTLNTYPIGPVTLADGTTFFAGAILTEQGFQAPAAIDLNSPHNNSWVRGWAPGLAPTPNQLGFNNLGQPALINLTNTAVPGVFIIRVN